MDFRVINVSLPINNYNNFLIIIINEKWLFARYKFDPGLIIGYDVLPWNGLWLLKLVLTYSN